MLLWRGGIPKTLQIPVWKDTVRTILHFRNCYFNKGLSPREHIDNIGSTFCDHFLNPPKKSVQKVETNGGFPETFFISDQPWYG